MEFRPQLRLFKNAFSSPIDFRGMRLKEKRPRSLPSVRQSLGIPSFRFDLFKRLKEERPITTKDRKEAKDRPNPRLSAPWGWEGNKPTVHPERSSWAASRCMCQGYSGGRWYPTVYPTILTLLSSSRALLNCRNSSHVTNYSVCAKDSSRLVVGIL